MEEIKYVVQTVEGKVEITEEKPLSYAIVNDYVASGVEKINYFYLPKDDFDKVKAELVNPEYPYECINVDHSDDKLAFQILILH